jgi:AcrR family transcriptional regulator
MARVETPSRRRTTRHRLLDAAMDVFAEKGYAGATISEIERRVGLAAGTGSLYRHFPSKEAILREAVEYEVARCRNELDAARALLPAIGDPLERQKQRFRHTLHGIQLFNRLFRLMLNDGDRVPETGAAVWAAVCRPSERYSESQTDVLDAIALTSLGGYHLFSLMQGRPFDGIEEEELIEILAELTAHHEQNRQPAAS